MHGPPSRRILIATAVALAVAGCLGGSTPSTTVTPTPTTSVGTDCPPALTVYELDEEPANTGAVVAYENLTAEQQETFHRAQNGSVEAFDYAWNDIDVVAYEGRYYRAGVVVC